MIRIIAIALLLSGCSLTPTQKKWAAIGASVVATGLIIAHEQDNGKPLSSSVVGGSKNGPFNPCPSGNSAGCK